MAKAETTVANVEQNNNPLAAASGWLQSARDYFDDLKAEMRKVTWPSPEQVKTTTAVVIAAVFSFALYFAVVDLIMGRAIKRIFDTFAK